MVMGRRDEKIVVHVSLSNHGNPNRDSQDQELFEKLTKEIEEITSRPEYEQIRPSVSDI
jgi:hypothetical protein